MIEPITPAYNAWEQDPDYLTAKAEYEEAIRVRSRIYKALRVTKDSTSDEYQVMNMAHVGAGYRVEEKRRNLQEATEIAKERNRAERLPEVHRRAETVLQLALEEDRATTT